MNCMEENLSGFKKLKHKGTYILFAFQKDGEALLFQRIRQHNNETMKTAVILAARKERDSEPSLSFDTFCRRFMSNGS